MTRLRTEYDFLVSQVADLINDRKVDEVTVRSLYQSCFEFEELTPQVASIAVVSTSGKSDSFSIKPLNVNINLKFALDTIFMSRPVFTENGIWLILSLLRALCYLLGSTVKPITKEEAILVYAVYRLRQADESRIIDYIKEIELYDDIKDAQEALNSLVKLNVLDIEDGDYFLKESVIIKK